MKKWFLLSFRSEEPGGRAATKIEEAGAPEAEPCLIPAEELPPAAVALSQMFSDPAIEESSAVHAVEPEKAGVTQSSIGEFSSAAPEPGATEQPNQEDLPEATAVGSGTQAEVMSSELPAASEILAEIFPAERALPADEAAPDTDKASMTIGSAEARWTAREDNTDETARGYGLAETAISSAAHQGHAKANTEGKETAGSSDAVKTPATRPENQRPAATPQGFHAPNRDWAFEEKLASHKEWVDSRGSRGNKGDFSGMDLEGTELIGVNFRFADFHDANLRAADLLLADLRDACLVRADLQDACLVGANLEGANLEDASLETAMGLVPRQVAGANLRDASLPAAFLEFPAAAALEKASRSASRYFTAMMSVVAVCWLVLWTTKDVQLVADSAIISFLKSRAAASALPTAESYLILPVAIFILYLIFQFQLQKIWDAVLELPAVFPDGRELGDGESGIVLALMRGHFHWIDQEGSSTRVVEKGVANVLAYWTVPATLLLFWARYLTRQEVRGTILHALLVVVATGVALYATTKTGHPPERWAPERKWHHRVGAKLREVNPATVACLLGAILLILSIGTIAGVPHAYHRAPQYSESNVRRWASTAFWCVGFDPYADLTEASLSTAPPSWNGSDAQVPSVIGPRLNAARLRYAQAYGVFLVNAHLWRANLQGAYLSEADLRGADLGQSDVRFALMDHANLSRANLDRAVLDHADMRRANLQNANLSHASLIGTTLTDATLEGAVFYGARLSDATFIRANLEKTDLRESYLEEAEMEHADLRGAYLWSARLPRADLKGAQLGDAILIDAYLPGADLRWAQFSGTVLTGANLRDTNLDGADMRGAGGLDANQVCSAKSHNGTLLDSALETQVAAQCGPAISTPAAIAPQSPGPSATAAAPSGKSSH